jgi:hypothetical protein
MKIARKIRILLFLKSVLWLLSLKPNTEKWELPEDRYYHEVIFLTAHNAFSNEEDGYVQPQQKWSLTKQLENGIRGFMLDTHYSSGLFGNTKKVRLCHYNAAITQMFLRPFNGKPTTFIKSLKIIKQFLEKHQKEIITLFLENYTQSNDIDNAISKSGIGDLILKPSDWNPGTESGWPHIKWLQKHNKRVIIFNQRGESNYCFDEWICHYENQYGTTDTNRAIKERAESVEKANNFRHLYVMNYFPHFYIKPVQRINFNKINSEGTNRLLAKSLSNGLSAKQIYKNRYPNFIAVDYVNEGNLITLVNQINIKASNRRKRKFMFRPMKYQHRPYITLRHRRYYKQS